MTALLGTNVAAKVVPFTDADTYATHEDTYGAGGWRAVSTFTDIAQIPVPRIKEGMAVFVLDERSLYVRVSGIWENINQAPTPPVSTNEGTWIVGSEVVDESAWTAGSNVVDEGLWVA